MIKKMEKVCKYGDPVNGVVMYTMAIGKMAKWMVMEFIHGKMEINISDNFLMTKWMERA